MPLLNAANPLLGINGGTGISNSGKTITLAGNLVLSGAFALTLTVTGTTNVTLPTTGTLITANANNIAFTGGTINGVVIGGVTPAAGTFSSLNDTALTASQAVVTDGAKNLASMPYASTGGSPAGGSSNFVTRDSNGNTAFNNATTTIAFNNVPGTITLNAGSARVQSFTGTGSGTLVLPDATTLIADHTFEVFSTATGNVTINDNSGGLVKSIPTNSYIIVRCINISTAGGQWIVNWPVVYDSFRNTTFNNYAVGTQANVASGTLLLSVSSGRVQTFSGGSGTFTVVMPDATTLINGWQYEFNNNTSGIVTVQDGGLSTLFVMAPGTYARVSLQLNTTVAGQWDYHWLMPTNAQYGTFGMTITGTLTVSSTIQNSALTASSLTMTDVSKNLMSLNLAAGQIPIGRTGNTPTAATLTAGAGISITSASGSITIASTGNPPPVEVTTTSQQMVSNTVYIANNAGLVTLTLPTSAAFGDQIVIQGKGAGGWKIAQNAGQFINLGNAVTTTGTGGSLASTNQFDSIVLICITATNQWSSVGSPQGIITIVE